VPEGSTSGEFPPHRRGVQEYLVVERGRLRAVLGGEEFLLDEGDAAYFEADIAHRFDNAGERECTYYVLRDSNGRSSKFSGGFEEIFVAQSCFAARAMAPVVIEPV
jgi:uncharacterized cupin superfamily protein